MIKVLNSFLLAVILISSQPAFACWIFKHVIQVDGGVEIKIEKSTKDGVETKYITDDDGMVMAGVVMEYCAKKLRTYNRSRPNRPDKIVDKDPIECQSEVKGIVSKIRAQAQKYFLETLNTSKDLFINNGGKVAAEKATREQARILQSLESVMMSSSQIRTDFERVYKSFDSLAGPTAGPNNGPSYTVLGDPSKPELATARYLSDIWVNWIQNLSIENGKVLETCNPDQVPISAEFIKNLTGVDWPQSKERAVTGNAPNEAK